MAFVDIVIINEIKIVLREFKEEKLTENETIFKLAEKFQELA